MFDLILPSHIRDGNTRGVAIFPHSFDHSLMLVPDRLNPWPDPVPFKSGKRGHQTNTLYLSARGGVALAGGQSEL